jgi:hypothetical protein
LSFLRDFLIGCLIMAVLVVAFVVVGQVFMFGWSD